MVIKKKFLEQTYAAQIDTGMEIALPGFLSDHFTPS
jgi:hypothetical protein